MGFHSVIGLHSTGKVKGFFFFSDIIKDSNQWILVNFELIKREIILGRPD